MDVLSLLLCGTAIVLQAFSVHLQLMSLRLQVIALSERGKSKEHGS